MKKIPLSLILVLLLSFLPLSLSATPETRVAEMINELTKTGSYLALLDYIHWPSSFAAMSVQDKQSMGISSPRELRVRVQSLMENPEQMFRQQFGEKVKTMPPDQQRIMEGYYQQQLAKMRQTLDEMRAKLRRTKYEILGSSINGNSATVTVKGQADGRTKLRDIQLNLIQGEWYLPAMNVNDGQLGAGMFGE